MRAAVRVARVLSTVLTGSGEAKRILGISGARWSFMVRRPLPLSAVLRPSGAQCSAGRQRRPSQLLSAVLTPALGYGLPRGIVRFGFCFFKRRP